MIIKNKRLLLASTSVLAILAWVFLRPATETAVEQSAPAPKPAAPQQMIPKPEQAPPVQTANQLNPYSDCPDTSEHAGLVRTELAEQLKPLLASGTTVSELLQYDVAGAVLPRAYANSIALAIQQKGLQKLNIKQPNVLDLLANRLKQEKQSAPEQFAKALAADEDFQVFVPLDFGTIMSSAYISPSLIFLRLSPKIPAAEFNTLIAGKTFSPLEIAVAIELQLPETHVLQLIAQGRDLTEFPAGYQSNQVNTPTWNLADIAAVNWQPKVLAALKRQGVVPTSIEGVVTGLDFALFSKPSRNLDLEKQPDLAKQLKQAQQDTVAYLLQEGYWAHGYLSKEGEWRFSSDFLNTINFKGTEILALLPTELQQSDKTASVFRSSGVKTIPLPAGSGLAAWVATENQQKALTKQTRQRCENEKSQLLEQEGLLTTQAIDTQIYKLREKQPIAEIALSQLHQQDPAWVAWHWRRGGAREGDANQLLRDQLEPLIQQPAELAAFLQTTELDSNTTAWLLANLIDKPDLVAAFNQRFAPKAPSFLYPLFQRLNQGELKALAVAGYDFALQDSYGRNLYMWAFYSSPDAALFMLEQGVSPFAQTIGPDALDMALDASYLQRQLHPALPKILAQLTDAEPSHLSRFKRLALYRPELYQAILTIKPDLKLPADTQPNALLSPPLW